MYIQKKYYSFLVIGLLTVVTGCFADTSWHSLAFDASGKPTAWIMNLLEQTGVSCERTMDGVVQATQESWLRKPGKERWEMEKRDDVSLDALREQIKLFVDTIDATGHEKKYTYLIILGALFSSMQGRLQTAMRLIDECGVKVDEIVYLVGQRPCYKDQGENEEVFKAHAGTDEIRKVPNDEASMAQFLHEYAKKSEGFAALPVLYVSAPMKEVAGKQVRPTTQDTVECFVQQVKKDRASCLVVSSQPFVLYQDSVLKTYLPASWSVCTVGDHSSRADDVAVVLDSVARYLYQEKIRYEKYTHK